MMYAKIFADSRLRVKGRFVKKEDEGNNEEAHDNLDRAARVFSNRGFLGLGMSMSNRALLSLKECVLLENTPRMHLTSYIFEFMQFRHLAINHVVLESS